MLIIIRRFARYVAGRRCAVPVRLRPSRLDDREMDSFYRRHFRFVHEVIADILYVIKIKKKKRTAWF